MKTPGKKLKSVNIHEAKTHFSRLVSRVEKGETILISRAGQPVARLVPVERPRGRRIGGRDAGRIWVSPDFDKPLTDKEFPISDDL